MKTKVRGRILAILVSLAMVFTMMPMIGGAAYADDTEVYTVTCYPGDGSGDPVVYNSEDHMYDSWMNVPPGVFFRTYEGEMWFTAPTMPNSFSPPQEGYGVVSWNDGNNDIPVGERFKMESQDITLTAKYAQFASYGLAPSSYTITQPGYTDIECSFTSLVLGPIENSGEDARYIGFYLNGGTLSDGKGNSIPFKVDNMYHFGAEDRKYQGNGHSDPEETFIVSVYIDPNDYQNASQGIYKGTYKIDSHWFGDHERPDGPSHKIELTLIVHDPAFIVEVPEGRNLTYNGKAQTGVDAGEGYILSETTSATNAGSYQATATLKEGYVWSDRDTDPRTITWKIDKAANPLTIKAKTATVKYSKVKKKARTLAVGKVIAFTKKGQGKMTYTKASGNKKITINKTTGKVKVKKGLKKGTYKVKVKVQAAGNANYNASPVKTVTFKVKVK